MLYGLLLTLFVILCFFLIIVILVQKSRSSMGLGGLGGGAQMLFGGSGGQDLFQKVTWVMVALFMAGSLVLAIMKSSGDKSLSYNIRPKMNAQPRPAAPAPAQDTTPVAAQTQPIMPSENATADIASAALPAAPTPTQAAAPTSTPTVPA